MPRIWSACPKRRSGIGRSSTRDAPVETPTIEGPREKPVARESTRRKPSTDAEVIARLEHSIRRACRARDVTVRFTVKSDGKAGLVRVQDRAAQAATVECIRSKVAATRFPAGELWALRLQP